MAGQHAAYSCLGQLQLACRLPWLASCRTILPWAGQTAPAHHVGQPPEVALPRWLAGPGAAVPPAGRGTASTASWPAKGATARPTGWPSAAPVDLGVASWILARLSDSVSRTPRTFGLAVLANTALMASQMTRTDGLASQPISRRAAGQPAGRSAWDWPAITSAIGILLRIS